MEPQDSLELQKMRDSLDSLHHRVGRFYAWASQLQVEFRDMKQRIGFLEAIVNENFVFKGEEGDETDECALLSRMDAIKSSEKKMPPSGLTP